MEMVHSGPGSAPGTYFQPSRKYVYILVKYQFLISMCCHYLAIHFHMQATHHAVMGVQP